MTRQNSIIGVLVAVSALLCAVAPRVSAQECIVCGDNCDAVFHFPGENTFGVLLYEDLFVDEGDFDFNDAVVAYSVSGTTRQGGINGLQIPIQVLAVGAGSVPSGLAVHLESVPADTEVEILFYPDGDPDTAVELEPWPGEADLVVTLYPNVREAFGNLGGFIDTDPELPHVGPPGPGVLVFRFADPISPDLLSIADAPFDIFFFRSGDISYQVHAPYHGGTDQMNEALFNTGDDGSGDGRWFVTVDGTPWLLNLPALLSPGVGEPVPTEIYWAYERARIEYLLTRLAAWAAWDPEDVENNPYNDFYLNGLDLDFSYQQSHGRPDPVALYEPEVPTPFWIPANACMGVCGDGVCGADENALTCPVDCFCPAGGSAPIAHWPLDNGTAVDVSGNGHNGTLSSAGVVATTDRHGNPNGALRFTTGDVTVPDHPDLDGFFEFTICTWISNEDTDGGAYLGKDYQGDGSNHSDSYELTLHPNGVGEPSFYVGFAGDGSEFRTTPVGTGSSVVMSPGWSHVCSVYDGDSLRSYIDGIQHSELPFADGQVRQTSSTLHFGKHGGDGRRNESARSFQGSLDDIRMWNRALTPCEIEAEFGGAVGCGDGTCEAGEDVVSCPEDCAPSCVDRHITNYWTDATDCWSDIELASDGDWDTATTCPHPNRNLFAEHPYDGFGGRTWTFKHSTGSGGQWAAFQCWGYASESWSTLYTQTNSNVPPTTYEFPLPDDCLVDPIQLRVRTNYGNGYYEGELREDPVRADCGGEELLINGDFDLPLENGWVIELDEGNREIVALPDHPTALHLENLGGSNRYLRFYQDVDVTGIDVNGVTLSWDWRTEQINSPYGMQNIIMTFYTDADDVSEAIFHQERHGGGAIYACSALQSEWEIPSVCVDETGSFTYSEWASNTVSLSDLFSQFGATIDSADVVRIRVMFTCYNNAGSGADVYFDDLSLWYAGPQPP